MQVGKFDVARLEPVGPLVELKRINLAEYLAKLGDRIVGIVRIGDMTLHAVHGDPHIDRTASTDFHHVTETVHRGRLADQTEIGRDAALGHQFHDRDRAETRGPLFIAGYDQADRAEIVGQVMERADKGRDTAFHVDGAAPVEQVTTLFRNERIGLPALAGWDDVEMTGVGKMARTGGAVANGKEILYRSAKLGIFGRIASNEPRYLEAERCEHRFHLVKHASGSRSDTGLGDQSLGIVEYRSTGHWRPISFLRFPVVRGVRSPMAHPRQLPSTGRSIHGREWSAYSWWQSRAGGIRMSGSARRLAQT